MLNCVASKRVVPWRPLSLSTAIRHLIFLNFPNMRVSKNYFQAWFCLYCFFYFAFIQGVKIPSHECGVCKVVKWFAQFPFLKMPSKQWVLFRHWGMPKNGVVQVDFQGLCTVLAIQLVCIGCSLVFTMRCDGEFYGQINNPITADGHFPHIFSKEH